MIENISAEIFALFRYLSHCIFYCRCQETKQKYILRTFRYNYITQKIPENNRDQRKSNSADHRRFALDTKRIEKHCVILIGAFTGYVPVKPSRRILPSCFSTILLFHPRPSPSQVRTFPPCLSPPLIYNIEHPFSGRFRSHLLSRTWM